MERTKPLTCLPTCLHNTKPMVPSFPAAACASIFWMGAMSDPNTGFPLNLQNLCSRNSAATSASLMERRWNRPHGDVLVLPDVLVSALLLLLLTVVAAGAWGLWCCRLKQHGVPTSLRPLAKPCRDAHDWCIVL